jgi:hypothetical protein
MIKRCTPFLILVLLSACAGNKEKNNPGTEANDQAPAATSTSTISGEDKAIKEWLLGKEWVAENGAAPFSTLKVYSADSCGYTTGKYHWTFKNGVFEMFGAEWPFTRVNDTTFTIYVKPSQKTYSYKFVKNL